MVEKINTIIYAGGSDRGKVRKQNEDSILMVSYDQGEVVLLLVADGVGGHGGGDIASQLVVDSIRTFVEKSVLQAHSGGGYAQDWLELTLQHAIAEANLKVIAQQKHQPEFNHMATTLVALLIHQHEMVLSHLGDSRCYQFNQQHLVQVTEDHTALQRLLNEGKITQEEFENLPMHHVISQGMGLTAEPDIQVSRLSIECESQFLLCSDGLSDFVSDEKIQLIMQKHEALNDAVDALITCANDNGGGDNISLVIVKRAE